MWNLVLDQPNIAEARREIGGAERQKNNISDCEPSKVPLVDY